LANLKDDVRNFGIIAGILPLKALIMSLNSIKAPEFLVHFYLLKIAPDIACDTPKYKKYAISAIRLAFV